MPGKCMYNVYGSSSGCSGLVPTFQSLLCRRLERRAGILFKYTLSEYTMHIQIYSAIINAAATLCFALCLCIVSSLGVRLDIVNAQIRILNLYKTACSKVHVQEDIQVCASSVFYE